jgi:membrane protein implicated in regulation of membrane protease activity
MLTPELVWFICGAVLVLLEFVVPGVVLVFFGLGAWIVALAVHTGEVQSIASQLFLFAGSSVV